MTAAIDTIIVNGRRVKRCQYEDHEFGPYRCSSEAHWRCGKLYACVEHVGTLLRGKRVILHRLPDPWKKS